MAYEPEIERLERRYQDDPARNFAQLAEAYRKANRLDDALTLLRGHLAERPNYVSGLVVLGRCLLDQQNDPEARETFARVLAVDAEHIIALRALGEISAREGDVVGAKGWYTRLLEVDPMNEEAEVAIQRLGEASAARAPAPAPLLDESAAADLEAAAFGAEPPPAVDLPEYAAEEAGSVELASHGGAPGTESDFVHEETSDSFLPRASNAFAQPKEIEQIGQVEITSQLPEEESLLSVPEGREAETEEAYSFPTGEQEVDLGFVERGEAPAAPEMTEAAGTAPGLPLQPFDDTLGWGAGERVSRQISQADLEELARVQASPESPVKELPGLETTEIPGGGEAVEVGSVEGLEADDTSGVTPLEGLEPALVDEGGEAGEPPLLFPGPPAREEDEAAPEAAPFVLEAEPEPVVTETMAELYVKQGMLDEARDVYERLLAQRPSDARLAERLAALRAGEAVRRPAESARYAASATGGQSARALLRSVLEARPSAGATGAPAGATPMVPTTPAVEVAEPEGPEPMERAFGEAHGNGALGAPTQPADDEVSLSAIFGDAVAPAVPATPPPVEPPQTTSPSRAPGGFSFDQFFGKAEPASATGEPRRDTLADDEGDEAFRDWLKGLKD